MVQAITKTLVAGEVAQFYTSEGYTHIAARVSAGAGPIFCGVKSNIPPAGTSGSMRLLGIDSEFVLGPGDSLYVGNTGALASDCSILVSPLPWPVRRDGDGLIQAAEFINYDGVLPLAVQPEPTRVYAASVYVELSISIRISTPGNGLFSFNSSMRDAYTIAAATRPLRCVMAPGDQLFVASTIAAVTSDFQAVISPCPWWNTAMMRSLF